MNDYSLRKKVHEWLDDTGPRRGLSLCINWILIVLITVNVLAVTLETVESIHRQHALAFSLFEAISVLIFGIEYLLRLWACVEDKQFAKARFPRLKYAMTPMALIDLLAILPFFLSQLFTLDLRFLRVLRLLRVFKLTRYSSAMNLLLDVFRAEARPLFAGFFIMFVLLVLAASGAYLAEHSAQPDKFGSIPAAMWWAVATLTTVGYGDVTPITVLGKLFGALVTVVGVGMAALPAGILASGLAGAISQKREALRRQLRKALENGDISSDEENEFEQLRMSLGVTQAVARSIRREFEAQQLRSGSYCPSCGHRFKPDLDEVES